MKRSGTLLTLAAALATALATTFTAAPTEAAQRFQTKCKGDSRACIQEARRTCRTGFRVLDSESHAGGLLSDVIPGPVMWYSMIYQCSNSPGYRPDFPMRGQAFRPPVMDDQDGFGAMDRGPDERMMARTCKGEAADQFGVRPRNIMTLPVERSGRGYSVYGQFEVVGEGATTFECRFDMAGRFRGLREN